MKTTGKKLPTYALAKRYYYVKPLCEDNKKISIKVIIKFNQASVYFYDHWPKRKYVTWKCKYVCECNAGWIWNHNKYVKKNTLNNT